MCRGEAGCLREVHALETSHGAIESLRLGRRGDTPYVVHLRSSLHFHFRGFNARQTSAADLHRQPAVRQDRATLRLQEANLAWVKAALTLSQAASKAQRVWASAGARGLHHEHGPSGLCRIATL